MALLPNTVGAVDRLSLDGRIPPRVEQEHVVSSGQVEAMAARSEADEEEPALGIVLKPLDNGLSVSCVAVEICVRDGVGVEPLSQQREEARELRKDERLVRFRGGLGEFGKENVQLRARCRLMGAGNQRRMARGLATRSMWGRSERR